VLQCVAVWRDNLEIADTLVGLRLWRVCQDAHGCRVEGYLAAH